MTTINDIIAQLTDSVGFEAPYTDDGRYTAFVTLHDDGFDTTYRVAYMRGIEFTHDEYFDADQLANEMTNLNADHAAWVRWECVDGDWNPVETASDAEHEVWTAVVETHRSGRPTGHTLAVKGDVFADEQHPLRGNWLMDCWQLCRTFSTEQEAADAAAARITYDADGWAVWV